ncbi:hypothetical protein HKX48_009588 [Thoreauomyces humboldtii]|nr:hypothetical protein HKX48_009588 [Thoreauomyces humboldtii]
MRSEGGMTPRQLWIKGLSHAQNTTTFDFADDDNAIRENVQEAQEFFFEDNGASAEIAGDAPHVIVSSIDFTVSEQCSDALAEVLQPLEQPELHGGAGPDLNFRIFQHALHTVHMFASREADA